MISTPQRGTVQNVFDRYLLNPPSAEKVKILETWKDHSIMFPHLSLIARDCFAVPAIDAGVEGVFSKSVRVAPCTRACLQARTISTTILYKDYLSRIRESLNKEMAKCKAECK